MLKIAIVAAVLAVPSFAQGWVNRSALNGPMPRAGHAMGYDAAHGYTMLVGGNNWMGHISETWTWDGSAWTLRGPAPTPYATALAFHASSGQMLAFHAVTSGLSFTVFAHQWNGSAWISLGAAGASANISSAAYAAAYDPVQQESVVYLGPNYVAVWNGSALSVVQVLAPAAHLQTNTDVSMAWDPVAGRLVLVGSQSIGSNYLTRAYEWTGFGWSLRQLTNPPSRAGSLTTDAAKNRMVMVDSDWNSLQSNHTWMLSNGTATHLAIGVGPTSREEGKSAYDPTRGVHVYFGGIANYFFFGDTWEFDLGPLASFTPYGNGCVGSRGVPSIAAQGTSLPRIGATFTANIQNLPWTGPAFLVLGLSNTSYGGTSLPIDLGFLGAPTCTLRASIDDIQPVVNILGAATWSWTVPPFPGHPFYAQVLPLDPGVNALGLTASNACHGVIGL